MQVYKTVLTTLLSTLCHSVREECQLGVYMLGKGEIYMPTSTWHLLTYLQVQQLSTTTAPNLMFLSDPCACSARTRTHTEPVACAGSQQQAPNLDLVCACSAGKIHNAQGVQNCLGALYMVASALAVMVGFDCQAGLSKERVVYYRERAAGSYGAAVYLFAQVGRLSASDTAVPCRVWGGLRFLGLRVKGSKGSRLESSSCEDRV